MQSVNSRVGNVHLGERFTALESPMAYVVCISTKLDLLNAACEEAPLREACGVAGVVCPPRLLH